MLLQWSFAFVPSELHYPIQVLLSMKCILVLVCQSRFALYMCRLIAKLSLLAEHYFIMLKISEYLLCPITLLLDLSRYPDLLETKNYKSFLMA